MRIAVNPLAEAGARAARLLLGERELISLGMLGRSLAHPDDPRAQAIEHLEGYDVLVSDDIDDPVAVATRCLDEGVGCVLWSDLWDDRDQLEELDEAFMDADLTLVVGASLGSGIASALAHHEVARTDEALQIDVAWTVPGRPLRRGEAVPFPRPVGSHWGREVEDPDVVEPFPLRRFVVPVQGEWAGAMARITGILEDGVARRVVGVADHAGHLEGIALTAGALAVTDGAYAAGLHWPAESGRYLERALEVGLAVATFTIDETSRREA